MKNSFGRVFLIRIHFHIGIEKQSLITTHWSLNSETRLKQYLNNKEKQYSATVFDILHAKCMRHNSNFQILYGDICFSTTKLEIFAPFSVVLIFFEESDENLSEI